MSAVPVRWSLEDKICEAYEVHGGGSSALHGHKHFLLTLITAGSGVQTLNGRAYPFGAGDLFVLSPADFHKNAAGSESGFDYYGVKFPFKLLDDRLAALCAMDRFPVFVHLPDTIYKTACSLFALLTEESANGRERIGNAEYMRALVEELMILAVRETEGAESAPPPTAVNRALGYLYMHFDEPIRVAQVASYVGYTPNYFNASFKAQMGRPLGVYLRDLRLAYAENLLLASRLSITDVCYESGFTSPSHFSRCFHEQYGVSPHQYRLQHEPSIQEGVQIR